MKREKIKINLRNNVYEIFLILVILVSLILIALSNPLVQGKVTQGDVPSNVSVLKSLAISFSSNLSAGIYFGEVNFLPATNVNATENYNGTANSTNYYIYVSSDGNIPVDLCMRANAGLTSLAGDTIGVGNESYASTVGLNNLTLPSVSNETSLNLNYSLGTSSIPVGNYSFIRFWLDIPSAQPAGQYNNSVFFKGIESGTAC